MDFKKLFKNKYFITICILIVLICIFASLTKVSDIFYIITYLLCSGLCVVVGVKNILNYKNAKNDNTAELLPLNQTQRELFDHSKKSECVGYIVKTIMFFAFGIVFFALIFN